MDERYGRTLSGPGALLLAALARQRKSENEEGEDERCAGMMQCALGLWNSRGHPAAKHNVLSSWGQGEWARWGGGHDVRL